MFYHPKLYKPPPKHELTEAERNTINVGGSLAPTEHQEASGAPAPPFSRRRHRRLRPRRTSPSRRARAAAPNRDSRLNLLTMALHGKKIGLDAVIEMIDLPIGLLGKVQVDDDAKEE